MWTRMSDLPARASFAPEGIRLGFCGKRPPSSPEAVADGGERLSADGEAMSAKRESLAARPKRPREPRQRPDFLWKRPTAIPKRLAADQQTLIAVLQTVADGRKRPPAAPYLWKTFGERPREPLRASSAALQPAFAGTRASSAPCVARSAGQPTG